MSISNEMSPADIRACTCDGNNGGWGGDWGIWIVVFLIFAMFGWGGYGGGFGGFGGNGGTAAGYTLASDFATVQRQLSDGFNSVDNALDRQNAGICDLGYTQLSLNNNTNMAMMQGFNNLSSQLASCCCETQQNIRENTTQGVMNTSAIQNQIQNCCCNIEKDFMQSRYDNAQANCATLTAIDKVGDRIIDFMCQEKTQALRDENQALRLAASQQMQNNYLVSALKPPAPVPAYSVPAPWNTGCGCGCSC